MIDGRGAPAHERGATSECHPRRLSKSGGISCHLAIADAGVAAFKVPVRHPTPPPPPPPPILDAHLSLPFLFVTQYAQGGGREREEERKRKKDETAERSSSTEV